jgi:hypothetical protein
VQVVVLPKSDPQLVDMAIGALHCQTILLSASFSSFAFWTAFLGIEKNVYHNLYRYNAPYHKDVRLVEGNFPPSWKPIFYNETDDTAQILNCGTCEDFVEHLPGKIEYAGW